MKLKSRSAILFRLGYLLLIVVVCGGSFLVFPNAPWQMKVFDAVFGSICVVALLKDYLKWNQRLEEIDIDTEQRVARVSVYQNFFLKTEEFVYKGSDVAVIETFSPHRFVLKFPGGETVFSENENVPGEGFLKAKKICDALGCKWEKNNQSVS